jgi:hypothetical protein
MKDKKGNLREHVVIMARNGDRHSYKLCLAMIHTKHADGTPALMKLVQDHEVVDLAGGEEFMTFYAPMNMIGEGGGA